MIHRQCFREVCNEWYNHRPFKIWQMTVVNRKANDPLHCNPASSGLMINFSCVGPESSASLPSISEVGLPKVGFVCWIIPNCVVLPGLTPLLPWWPHARGDIRWHSSLTRMPRSLERFGGKGLNKTRQVEPRWSPQCMFSRARHM